MDVVGAPLTHGRQPRRTAGKYGLQNQTDVLLNLPGAAQIGGGKNPSRAEPLPGKKVAARAVAIPRVDPPLSAPQKLGVLRD